jgi:hypothetical protein
VVTLLDYVNKDIVLFMFSYFYGMLTKEICPDFIVNTDLLPCQIVHKATTSTTKMTNIMSTETFLLREKDYSRQVNSEDIMLSDCLYRLRTGRTQISRGVVYSEISIEEEHIL